MWQGKLSGHCLRAHISGCGIPANGHTLWPNISGSARLRARSMQDGVGGNRCTHASESHKFAGVSDLGLFCKTNLGHAGDYDSCVILRVPENYQLRRPPLEPTMSSVPDTLFSLLTDAAKRSGDAPLYRFLVQGDVEGPQEMLSASALESDARRIGAALRPLRTLSNDAPPRVLVACSSPIEFARAFFGCLSAGVVPVPVNPPLRSTAAALNGIRSVLQDAQPSLVIGDGASITAIRSADQDIEHGPILCPAFTPSELMASVTASEFETIRASPDDIAFLQYTSGSTSAPRGVMISHANILSNLRSLASSFGAPPGAIGVSWLPLTHDLGLIGNLLLFLYTGLELVLMTPLAFVARPARWFKAISKFRAWGTSAPNFALALCERVIRKSELEDVDLSCLEALFCGAEPIDASIVDKFSHRFAPYGFRRGSLRPCYGLAEATLFVSWAEPEKLLVKRFDPTALVNGRLQEQSGEKGGRAIVSCGKVQPDLCIAIVDPGTGRGLDNDEIGEIWLSGDPIAQGYFGHSERENDEVFRAALASSNPLASCNQGYLRTGDLGALHDGDLYITGRIKELIIVRGRNYDAHDLERITVTAHPDLSAGRVVVFADFEHGEQIVVLVELPTRPAEREYRTIARRIRSRLVEATGLRINCVVIAPPKSIPVTSSGKLRRVEVHRRYKGGSIVPLFIDQLPSERDGEPSSLNRESPSLDDDFSSEVIEKVLVREIKIAARLGQRERLSPQTRLSELGVDSLGLVQIATAMQDFLDCHIPLSIVDDDPPLSILIERLRTPGNWHAPYSETLQPVENNSDRAAFGITAASLPELSILFFASEDQADRQNRYRFVQEAALLADRKGFSAIWVPERHFHPFGGLFPSPAVLSASLAAHTKRVRLRAGSVVLPLNDPLRVAEEWAMVDNLSGGRVDLALATGWDADSFVLAPDNYPRRHEVLFEYAQQLTHLWSGGSLTRRNGGGITGEVRTYPRPLQAELKIWITATHRAELFERAGRAGFNVLTALLMQDVDKLEANIRRYRKARHAAGHDPAAGCVSVMLHTYVGSSDKEARSTARQPLFNYLKSSIELWRKESEELSKLPADQVGEVAVSRYIHRSSLVGDSNTALRMLAKLRGIGVDEVACLVDFGIAPEAALGSLERLSNAVAGVRADTRPALDEPALGSISDARHVIRKSAFEDVFEPAFQFHQLVQKSDLTPFYRAFSHWEGTHARLAGRRILILSAFDYLGLGNSARVRAAAARAAEESGTSRSGSRVHSGTTPEVLALEAKLAHFLHRQDALICTTGYDAMAAVVTTFMNSRTTLVVDEAIHASILDGAANSHCRILRFRHNDFRELDTILEEAKSAMVMVEGLYSNHGDLAPLPEIKEICTRHGVRLALDDAHGLGVLGSTGRGAEEHYGLIGASDIIAGTFSKSLASIGGWISGDHDVIEYVRYHGRSVLFTAAISPPMVAAASSALDILIEQPELVEQLARNADGLRRGLRNWSVPVAWCQGPILRVPIKDDAKCIRLASELLQRGIYVNSVLYPSVPRNEAMIRLCVSAGHDPAELHRAAEEFGIAYRSIMGSEPWLRQIRDDQPV
jgi:natural product biosynthesis luciferase-like monooxygenase protein